jgi:hypothetical protein
VPGLSDLFWETKHRVAGAIAAIMPPHATFRKSVVCAIIAATGGAKQCGQARTRTSGPNTTEKTVRSPTTSSRASGSGTVQRYQADFSGHPRSRASGHGPTLRAATTSWLTYVKAQASLRPDRYAWRCDHQPPASRPAAKIPAPNPALSFSWRLRSLARTECGGLKRPPSSRGMSLQILALCAIAPSGSGTAGRRGVSAPRSSIALSQR